jgi:glycosyltransferase involved in cell wall biosynthesis
LRIGYVCGDVEVPIFGQEGSSVHIQALANAFVDMGHEVFVTGSWVGKQSEQPKFRIRELQKSAFEQELREVVLRDLALQCERLCRDLQSLAFNEQLLREGQKIIQNEKPDFVYERYSLFGWGAIELCHQFGIPHVLEVNAPLVQEQLGYEKFVLVEAAKAIDRMIFRRAAAIVVVSEWLKNWVVGLGADPDAVWVIPNGVSMDFLEARISKANSRAKIGLLANPLVGYMGSFQRWHDVHGLVRAFARVRERIPSARLLLVGDGEARKGVQELSVEIGIGDAVLFSGYVAHEKIPEHFAAVDVAVVPYADRANFYFSPLKLFESMGLGVPTIAADIGDIGSSVEHGRTGWLYPPGDQEKLSALLVAAIENPKTSEAVGAAGREYVLTNHSWLCIAEKIIAIAKALLARSSAR